MTRPDPGPGVELDVDATSAIADRLARASAPLAAAASSAPDLPRAGPSTGAVLAYLEALARASGGYGHATDGLAARVRDAVAAVRHQDRDGATRLAPPTGPTGPTR